MRAVPILVILIAVAVTAGCLEDSPKPADASDDAPEAVTMKLSLASAGRVLASEAGHRIAEFNAARDPNDPTHLAIAAMDYDDPSGMPACVTYHSNDGGATWRAGASVPGLDRPYLRFDPWTAIDHQSRVHLLCIPEQSQVGLPASNGVYYSRSDDGGRTWSAAVRVPTIDPAQRVDKVAMTVTRNSTVVACFGESGKGLVIARSFDAGTTWAPTVQTEVPGGLCAGVFETPDGRLHIGYTGGGNVRLASSSDGGTTWKPVDVGPYKIYPHYNNGYRVVTPYPMTTTPNFAHSPITGEIVAAVQTWDEAGERWVLGLHGSKDGGATFAPLQQPDFEALSCGKCHATQPLVAFDDRGRLGLEVTFLSDGGLEREVHFAASADDGQTWGAPVVLAMTDRSASYVDARTWTRDPEAIANLALYAAQNPTDAPHTLTWVAATAALVEPMQMRWGGEYWGMVGTADGFVPLWLDFSQNGVPQLWSDRVAITLLANSSEMKP